MIKLKVVSLLSLLIFFAGSSVNTGYNIGDAATDFKLKNVDGKFVSMADYKDAKGFILTFTCNTCPYSKMYEQRIIDLHNMYASKGFPVIAFNSNDVNQKPGDSFEEMVKLAKDKKYPFPYLYDESQEIAKAYGATNTPHIYVVEKEKNDFKVAYIGAIDNNARSGKDADKNYVKDAIESIMAGQKVKMEKTKAIGCTIKWKGV